MQTFNLQHYQNRLLSKLLVWSGLSLVAGLFLQVLRDPFGRGLGQQFAGWGLVDGLIALAGLSVARRQAVLPTTPVLSAQVYIDEGKDARNLQRLLTINSVLDVFYMAGGLQLMRSKGARDAYWRGSGLGIIIQAGFLFFFDLLHARRIPVSSTKR